MKRKVEIGDFYFDQVNKESFVIIRLISDMYLTSCGLFWMGSYINQITEDDLELCTFIQGIDK